MKLTQEQRETILERRNTLENAKIELKKSFKGIDPIIDKLVDLARPFYILPQSLKRPLLINLWGLTGHGKTTLVEKFIDLIDLKHQFFKIDIGDYANAEGEYRLRSHLSKKAEQCLNKHIILAFDEFQLGRTIDDFGQEIDRQGLRALWDVIDSGLIYQSTNEAAGALKVINNIRACLDGGVQVENGIVIHGEDVHNGIVLNHTYGLLYPVNYSEIVTVNSKPLKVSGREIENPYAAIPNSPNYLPFLKKPYLISYLDFLKLFDCNPSFFNNIKDYKYWVTSVFAKSGQEIYELLIKEFVLAFEAMSSDDYSQSLIFILGNIDEAYSMTSSTNPDSDADLYHEHSLKITTPQIKEALAKRYRMEQIGRLGNNHIICPSFTKETYESIIKLNLENRVNDIKKEFDIEICFDQSISDIIYKEGVFPTQGARPVLSSIGALVDTYTTKIIFDIVMLNTDITKINWAFDLEKSEHVVNLFSGKKLVNTMRYPVELNLDNLRKSDHSEKQTQVAVHEAGHAVASIVNAGLVPTEVKSRTASVAEGVCFFKPINITTRESLFDDIVMLVSGLEAEKLIFGKDFMSAGGSSDLKKATSLATSMIKTYGMGDQMHQISVASKGPNAIYNASFNSQAENEAVAIIEEARMVSQESLKKKIDFLLELSRHLADHSSILQEDITAMAIRHGCTIKNNDDYYDFKKMLAEYQPEAS